MDTNFAMSLKELETKKIASYRLFSLDNQVTDGIAVTAYGQGQVTGATYTVPAHGEITVDFELHILCVTPDDVKKLNELVRSLLEASKQHEFDDLQKTSISGGISFFPFFSFGARASYEETKHTMDKWGLSEENQRTIVTNMMTLAQKTNDFSYKGTVFNREYDYDVAGNLFGIVMDADIQQTSNHNQVRFLAPRVHLQSPEGITLPSVGDLYT